MDGDVDADDIRACTRAQAAALFKRHFWDALGCAALPLPLAVTLYDGAVNMGPGRAVRQMQRGMNLRPEDVLGGKRRPDLVLARQVSMRDARIRSYGPGEPPRWM